MAHIGIKLADGSFYPILDEDSAARKAMVVTTVKDRQPSVRINLYKAADGTASTGMLYIGSLLIEDLPLQARGGPDIRLELSLDEAGELQVEASEKTSGASQSLSVTLGELEAPADDDGPDFDLGAIGELDDSAAAGTEEPPISLVGEELDSEFPPMDDELDSEFPALDNELPPLDDELAEPETNEAGLGNLDSEFPALDDDLPALDDELAGNGDMADFSLSDADGLDTSPYNDDSLDVPSAEDFETAAAAAASENFDMPDDFESDSEATADATAGDDEFGNPSDEFGNPSDEFSSDDDFVNSTTDYEMPSDDNPTPLEVPLTTTTQRPVRARREASPPVDDDSEPGVGRQGRGLPVWLRIVFSLIILAALLGLAFVVYRCVTDRTPLIPESSVQQPLPPLVVPTLPPLAPPPAAAPAETTPPPVATPATTPAATTPPPTSSQPAPAAGSAQRGDQPPTTPREPGVWYRLRWGDTLWDLSNAYYRNPWQYMKIFRANPGVIEHPDRIIATTWIYIPK